MIYDQDAHRALGASDEDDGWMEREGRTVQLQSPSIDVRSREICREWKDLEKDTPTKMVAAAATRARRAGAASVNKGLPSERSPTRGVSRKG